MKGLLINNLYAALPNMKVFSGIMLLLGVFVAAMDNRVPSLVIGYTLLAVIGFSFTAIASVRAEETSQWSRYKLTAPIQRADIVKSYFVSQFLWMSLGVVFAGAGVGASVLLHGFPFDRNTDVFLLLVVGCGVSLFMGAVFFPLHCCAGAERTEAFLVVGLLCGVGIVMGMTSLINLLFPAMTTPQILLAGAAMLGCALLAFGLSCLLTIVLFKRK